LVFKFIFIQLATARNDTQTSPPDMVKSQPVLQPSNAVCRPYPNISGTNLMLQILSTEPTSLQ